MPTDAASSCWSHNALQLREAWLISAHAHWRSTTQLQLRTQAPDPGPGTKLDTVICYFFGVEIFSDGALRPKFCYANIFPTLIFYKYACAYTRAKRAQRRTSIFPLLLPEQDQPRMSILRYFKPPLPLYERESLLTHTRPRLSRASLEIFSNWKYFRTTRRVRK